MALFGGISVFFSFGMNSRPILYCSVFSALQRKYVVNFVLLSACIFIYLFICLQ